MSQSRRANENATKVDRDSSFPLHEAVALLQTLRKPKFDETVELTARLGVDPKKSDQMVRGAVSLPHGLGKTVRVICFAEGDAADAAKAAGAMEVGGEDLAKRIADGWMDFDVAIAHPSMMKVVGKLGRVLGPQGKMPAPKAGTVTQDVGTAVTEFQAGKIDFRVDSGGNVHVPVGKLSFSTEKLVENATTFLDFLVTLRPSTVKGNYLRNVSVSATMSPGVRVDFTG